MRTARALPTLVLPLLTLLAASCDAATASPPATGSPAATGEPWDGRTVTRHRDPETGLAFPMPAAGHRLETEHFDRGLPPHKARDIYTLRGPAGEAVTVDVWDNPDAAPLDTWFDAHLRFLTAAPATVTRATATARRLPAIVVDQPRSPQAPHRRIVVLAAGARLYRVTCHDADDPGVRAAFERLLGGLAPGDVR